MICRMWRGWTARNDADAYHRYLEHDLYPRLARELTGRGFRGFHILRCDRGGEVEFVTLTWFSSMDAVKAFAGEFYERAMISGVAARLLSRHSETADHYDVAACAHSGNGN